MSMRLLDTYCGIGGAGRGYQDAGFHVTGIDINDQPDYAGDEFYRGDACEYIRTHGHLFDFIHASPPCQASSTLTKGSNKALGRIYPQLIPQTREALDGTGVPYIIENVNGAPVRKDITLCGEMFGLKVIRHRHFETSGWECARPVHVRHRGLVKGYSHGVYQDGPYFPVYGNGGDKGSTPEWQDAMGIDWSTDRKGIREAIPPAYTSWIGNQFLAQVVTSVAA